MLMPKMLVMLGLCHCGQDSSGQTLLGHIKTYTGICYAVSLLSYRMNVTASSMHNDLGRWWRLVVGFDVCSRVEIG